MKKYNKNINENFDFDSVNKQKKSINAYDILIKDKINDVVHKILNKGKLSEKDKKFILSLPPASYETNDEEISDLIKKCLKVFGNKCDLNWIDTSNVTTMQMLFFDTEFNGNISKWNTSNVTDMSGMFWQNPKFNGDISRWDVSNVDNMSCMFFNAGSFKKDLSMWNVKDTTNLVQTFNGSPINRQPPAWYNRDYNRKDKKKKINESTIIMKKQDMYKNLIIDLRKSIRRSINEAFDFGTVNNTKSTAQRVADQNRAIVQEENITAFLKGFLKELNGSDNIEIERQGLGWYGHSSKNSWNSLDVMVIPQDRVNVEVQVNGFQIVHKTFELALNFAKKNNIVINKIVFEGVANKKHNFFSFNVASILTWNEYSLPDQIIFKNKQGEEKEAICVIQQSITPIVLTEDSLDILEYINEHFVDIIFLGFEGESQTFINENVYQLGIPNPQAYLKSKKLKCETKDLQRVEDLLKKGKSCESMAKAIGEKNMSKAGSRFVASLRLLNLPVPPFDDNNEALEEIMQYYSDFFQSVSTNNPEVQKSLNKIKTLCPAYFAKKFLELGGTMEDIFAMYDASYGDEANPDTITARQQKINSFSKATTEKYGRLKDFVVFLDSLNIPYSVDPIDKRTTSGWGSKQEWQGVTLFDDDDPNTAHFAITSSEGMVRGNGDRVGSYRVDGGWGRYGYRSRYKTEYAQNGNWRMEGELEVIHISDNLKPFLKEGPINLTQVRNAIKKFLKSIGK